MLLINPFNKELDFYTTIWYPIDIIYSDEEIN
jgi:hypothetical protein